MGLEVGVVASIPFAPPSSTQTRSEGVVIRTAEVTSLLCPDVVALEHLLNVTDLVRVATIFDSTQCLIFFLHPMDWIRQHADLIRAFIGEPPCADLI
jgi:hypothetical protein